MSAIPARPSFANAIITTPSTQVQLPPDANPAEAIPTQERQEAVPVDQNAVGLAAAHDSEPNQVNFGSPSQVTTSALPEIEHQTPDDVPHLQNGRNILQGASLNNRLTELSDNAQEGKTALLNRRQELQTMQATLSPDSPPYKHIAETLEGIDNAVERLDKVMAKLNSRDPKAVAGLQEFLVQKDNSNADEPSFKNQLTYEKPDGTTAFYDNMYGKRTDQSLRTYIQRVVEETRTEGPHASENIHAEPEVNAPDVDNPDVDDTADVVDDNPGVDDTADVVDGNPGVDDTADVVDDNPGVDDTADVVDDNPDVDDTADVVDENPGVDGTADVVDENPGVDGTADVVDENPGIEGIDDSAEIMMSTPGVSEAYADTMSFIENEQLFVQDMFILALKKDALVQKISTAVSSDDRAELMDEANKLRQEIEDFDATNKQKGQQLAQLQRNLSPEETLQIQEYILNLPAVKAYRQSISEPQQASALQTEVVQLASLSNFDNLMGGMNNIYGNMTMMA